MTWILHCNHCCRRSLQWSVGTQRNGPSQVSWGKVLSYLIMKKMKFRSKSQDKIGSRKERNVHETTEPLEKVIESLRLEKTSQTTRSHKGKEKHQIKSQESTRGDSRWVFQSSCQKWSFKYFKMIINILGLADWFSLMFFWEKKKKNYEKLITSLKSGKAALLAPVLTDNV